MAALTNIYDRAERAADHFERFLVLMDGLRDEVLDENCEVIPKYAAAEHLLGVIDDETQYAWSKVESLLAELKRADG